MNSLPNFLSRRPLAVGSLPVLLIAALLSSTPAAAYEGYGYQTVGGQGGSTCHVTTLAGSGSGSLSNCVQNRSGARVVVFDIAGTITVSGTLRIESPYLTIDGSTAPTPGITIRPPSSSQTLFAVDDAHDIIIRGVRLKGYDSGNGADLIRLDGDNGEIYNVVIDHVTLTEADDGAIDITESVRDVTVSWSFLYDNELASLVKYGTRRRISFHHNVFARNTERNPQVQGDLQDLDFVNNVVFDWGRGGWGYGLRIRNVVSEGRVSANVVNNHFAEGTGDPAYGLVFGSDPGSDSEDGGPGGAPAQGTVVGSTRLGSLWVSGNVLTSDNWDHYSTVSTPLTVPVAARVTTWPASELGSRVVPVVGMVHRTTAENDLLAQIPGASAPIPAGPPFGSVDTPANGMGGVTGSLGITGWALDDREVVRVEIYRDPLGGEPVGANGKVYVGDATFVAGARPDVEAAYSAYPNADRAGWGYMLLTNMLPNQGNGSFTFHAWAVDDAGGATLLDTRTITCTNSSATKPFGTLDTPGPGASATGSSYLVWGWALTPQPAVIPVTGATLQVYVDGVPVGTPTYNVYRADIASLFPGYANTDGAVFYFALDTTTLSNGIHEIAVSVTDSLGSSEGIGSRYFWVDN